MTDGKTALLIVDYQNDFCPPVSVCEAAVPQVPQQLTAADQNGPLAVPGALELTPILNDLLTLKFDLKIATRDVHPQNHVSFASNHSPPDNKAFETVLTIANPRNETETQQCRLWPDHCVQGTPGCELVAGLDHTRLDHIVDKGQDDRVEMYSAFAAPFVDPPVAKSTLADILRGAGITRVYVVGLALDYCVLHTAVDAAKEGFTTCVIQDATRAIDGGDASIKGIYKDFAISQVTTISLDAPELTALC